MQDAAALMTGDFHCCPSLARQLLLTVSFPAAAAAAAAAMRSVAVFLMWHLGDLQHLAWLVVKAREMGVRPSNPAVAAAHTICKLARRQAVSKAPPLLTE